MKQPRLSILWQPGGRHGGGCSRGCMPAADAPGQDAEPAEYMPVDVFRLGGILRLLEELLDSRHPASFLGLFHPVTDKDMKVPLPRSK